MRITITISDESGVELFTSQTVCPDDGTAIDKHLANTVEDVKDSLLRRALDSLRPQSS